MNFFFVMTRESLKDNEKKRWFRHLALPVPVALHYQFSGKFRKFLEHPTPLVRYYPFLLTSLTNLFLAVTHSLKTRPTSQGEPAHIRLSFKSSPADIRYYNSPPLRSPTTRRHHRTISEPGFDTKYNTPPH